MMDYSDRVSCVSTLPLTIKIVLIDTVQMSQTKEKLNNFRRYTKNLNLNFITTHTNFNLLNLVQNS